MTSVFYPTAPATGLRVSLAAAAVLLSFCSFPSPSRSADVKTLSGRAYKGDVLSVSDQEIKLRVQEEEVVIPTAELLTIDFEAKPTAATGPYQEAKLTDGTLLRCQEFSLKGKDAELRLVGGIALRFPSSSLRYVLYDAQDGPRRAEFEKDLAKTANVDVLFLTSIQDPSKILDFKGFVGDADDKGEFLQFKEADGRAAPPQKMSRVRGIIFSRKPAEGEAVGKVSDQGQSTFLVQKLGMTEQGYRIVTPVGLEVELPRAQVQRFDFSYGKIAYLGDLDPVQVQEIPILADVWHYRRDGKNLEGGPMRLAGKTYDKGLAVHSKTVLVYSVKGYNFFRCVLGIDDSVVGPAHAVVRIEGDGKLLYTTEVKTTSKEDKPQELNLPITGVQLLRLVVDYGEDLDLGDHVDFAEARVTK
jgi:hypothetical protein